MIWLRPFSTHTCRKKHGVALYLLSSIFGLSPSLPSSAFSSSSESATSLLVLIVNNQTFFVTDFNFCHRTPLTAGRRIHKQDRPYKAPPVPSCGETLRMEKTTHKACAFMMRSIFADHQYSDVVSTHGESAILELIKTFSTL